VVLDRGVVLLAAGERADWRPLDAAFDWQLALLRRVGFAHAADLSFASWVASSNSRPMSDWQLGEAMVSMIDQSGLITEISFTRSTKRAAFSVMGSI